MNGRRIGAGLCLLICIPCGTAGQSTNGEASLGFAADLGEKEAMITALQPKPATFKSFNDRLDFIHDNLQMSLQRYVEEADTMLDDGTVEKVATPPSRFRLTPYFVLKYDEKMKVALEPDFQAKIDVPNLEKRLAVFLDSSRKDLLPGIDPVERKQNAQIGLRNFWHRQFELDVGIRFRWPPEFFTGVEWNHRHNLGHVLLQPRQKVSYESEDGVCSLTSLAVHRWFGRRKDFFWQAVSAARYTTKTTDGVEMEQTIKLGWIRQALESIWTWKDVPGEEDISRGHTLRYSMFGHVNSRESLMDRYRATYTYRHRLYHHWIYIELQPGIEVAKENGWEPVPSVSVAVDMLFWGTRQR